MPAAIAPEVTIRYSFFDEIELIDHAAQQVDIDLPAGCDETGADFNDDSHNCSFAGRGEINSVAAGNPSRSVRRADATHPAEGTTSLS